MDALITVIFIRMFSLLVMCLEKARKKKEENVKMASAGKLYPSPRVFIDLRETLYIYHHCSPFCESRKSPHFCSREHRKTKRKLFSSLCIREEFSFHFCSLISFSTDRILLFSPLSQVVLFSFIPKTLSYICAAEKKAFTIFLTNLHGEKKV